MSALRRKRARCACLCLAMLGVPLGLGACGGDEKGDGGGDSAAGHVMKKTLPAEIDEHPQTFSSAETLQPVQNAWRTSSHRRFTQVEAGAVGSDRSTGALVVFRHEFVNAHQSSAIVKVIGSGPLRITHAPMGRKVEESAQRSGTIGFVGARGVRGELDLRDDQVTLSPPT